jgi:uncharacterized Rmd1/YagE family protein
MLASAMATKLHQFYAVAFEENFVLKDLARLYPEGRLTLRELRGTCGEGDVFLYPFGAMVFRDVSQELRLAEGKRLSDTVHLTTRVVREDFVVQESPDAEIGVREGHLAVDRLTPERASVVALTVAQSAAMEYYETIVESMFTRTNALVQRLEKRGTVSLRVRPLHRFIGESISTRSEVLSVLHLLDKPDATWDDRAMDRIYNDLRAEFDLVDRYQSMESKLRSVQEALELILDVARDRRMLILEVGLGLLFVFEVALEMVRR